MRKALREGTAIYDRIENLIALCYYYALIYVTVIEKWHEAIRNRVNAHRCYVHAGITRHARVYREIIEICGQFCSVISCLK